MRLSFLAGAVIRQGPPDEVNTTEALREIYDMEIRVTVLTWWGAPRERCCNRQAVGCYAPPAPGSTNVVMNLSLRSCGQALLATQERRRAVAPVAKERTKVISFLLCR